MKPANATAFAVAGVLLLSGMLPAALADMQTFNSATPASNAATRDAWLAAIGIVAPEHRVDFENGFANGQNVSGVGGLFPAGLVITDAGTGIPEAVVRSGAGIVGGSNPVGAFALTHDGDPNLVLDFATSVVLARSVATISGTANGITRTRKLTVNPAASVSPTSLKFGEVAIGSSSAVLTARLTNRGTVSFVVTGITLTGSNAPYYAQANDCPAELAAGES